MSTPVTESHKKVRDPENKAVERVIHIFGEHRRSDGTAVLESEHKAIPDVVVTSSLSTSLIAVQGEPTTTPASSLITRRHYFRTHQSTHMVPFFVTILPEGYMRTQKKHVNMKGGGPQKSLPSLSSTKKNNTKSPFFDPKDARCVPGGGVSVDEPVDLLEGILSSNSGSSNKEESMISPSEKPIQSSTLSDFNTQSKVAYTHTGSHAVIPIAFHFANVIRFYAYVFHKHHHGSYGTTGATSCTNYIIRFLGHQQIKAIKQGLRFVSCEVFGLSEDGEESDVTHTGYYSYTDMISETKASTLQYDPDQIPATKAVTTTPSSSQSTILKKKTVQILLIDYAFLNQLIEIFDSKITKDEQKECFFGRTLSELVSFVINPIGGGDARSQNYGTWKETCPPKTCNDIFTNITSFRTHISLLEIFECGPDPPETSVALPLRKAGTKKKSSGSSTCAGSKGALPVEAVLATIKPQKKIAHESPSTESASVPPIQPAPVSEKTGERLRPPTQTREVREKDDPPPSQAVHVEPKITSEKERPEQNDVHYHPRPPTISPPLLHHNDATTNYAEIAREYRRLISFTMDLERIHIEKRHQQQLDVSFEQIETEKMHSTSLCARCRSCICYDHMRASPVSPQSIDEESSLKRKGSESATHAAKKRRKEMEKN